MKDMQATITLTNINEKTMDQVIVEEIEDIHDFKYLDNQNCECHVIAKKNAFKYERFTSLYKLEIIINSLESYITIDSPEGFLKFDIKVIDFIFDNDILEMRYFLQGEERLFTISYK